MSGDKYPSIFSRQMATIVYIFLGKLWSHDPSCKGPIDISIPLGRVRFKLQIALFTSILEFRFISRVINA